MYVHSSDWQPVSRQIPISSFDALPYFFSLRFRYSDIVPCDVETDAFHVQLCEAGRDGVDRRVCVRTRQFTPRFTDNKEFQER